MTPSYDQSLQVGGTHYASPFPHLQLAQSFGPWCEMNFAKYISRHAKKDGAKDVLKAISYLKILMQVTPTNERSFYVMPEERLFFKFCEANDIQGFDRDALTFLELWMTTGDRSHLTQAVRAARSILVHTYHVDPDDPVGE